MLRIRYVGVDGRTRVTDANRVKFLSDGFRDTDKRDEREDSLKGPILLVHLNRPKGGKRLTMQVPEGFDMEGAKQQLLERGWLDLSSCKVAMEHLY